MLEAAPVAGQETAGTNVPWSEKQFRRFPVHLKNCCGRNLPAAVSKRMKV
jgi:hypothetical protein